MSFKASLFEKWRKRITFTSLFFAGTSGYLTYYGYGLILSTFIAALLALVSVAIQGGVWPYLYSVWGDTKPKHRPSVMVIGVLGMGIASVTSSYAVWIAIAGHQSQRYHMQRIVDASTLTLEQLVEQRTREAELIHPILSQNAASLRRMSSEEARIGVFGAGGGKGPNAAGLESMANAYDDAAKLVSEASDSQQLAAQEAADLLASMRVLLADMLSESGDPEQTQQAFASQLFRLNRNLATLQRSSVSLAQNVVEQSDAIVASIPASTRARTEAARERHKAAKAGIMKLAEESKSNVLTVIRKLDRRQIRVESFSLLSVEEASQAYLWPLRQYAIYAITIDNAPLLGLLMLHHLSRGRPGRRRKKRRDRKGKKPLVRKEAPVITPETRRVSTLLAALERGGAHEPN